MVGRAAVLLAHDTGDVERDPPLLQKNWWLMEMNWSDGELVRRIGLGPDAVAEAGLFDRMAPRIRLYGLRHLRDRDAAEDLVQNVLIVTLEALRAGRLREGDRLARFSHQPFLTSSKSEKAKVWRNCREFEKRKK